MGLFDFNANEPLSYEALQMRRKIAEQLAARKGQPPVIQNVGQGLFSAADSFARAAEQRDLETKLAAYEKGYQSDVDRRYPQSGGTSSVAPLAVPTLPKPTLGRRAAVPDSSVADIGQPPMGSTFNMADYGLRRPEDDLYG